MKARLRAHDLGFRYWDLGFRVGVLGSGKLGRVKTMHIDGLQIFWPKVALVRSLRSEGSLHTFPRITAVKV